MHDDLAPVKAEFALYFEFFDRAGDHFPLFFFWGDRGNEGYTKGAEGSGAALAGGFFAALKGVRKGFAALSSGCLFASLILEHRFTQRGISTAHWAHFGLMSSPNL